MTTNNLPAITNGSSKQIQWATQIRSEALSQAIAGELACPGERRGDVRVPKSFPKQYTRGEGALPALTVAQAEIANAACAALPTDATWWIDNRNYTVSAAIYAAAVVDQYPVVKTDNARRPYTVPTLGVAVTADLTNSTADVTEFDVHRLAVELVRRVR